MKKLLVNGLAALLGGGQTYLHHLFAEFPEADIHLAIPDELVTAVPRHARLHLVATRFAQKSLVHRLIWENFALPKYVQQHGIDIYYQPSGLLPWRSIRPARSAIAFRNMLPFAPVERKRFSLGYKRVRYWLLRRSLARAFTRADLVIFISHFAKQVIDQELPSRRGESVVVYHGLDESFRRPSPRPAGLPEEYVLYVSILNYYKAQVEVVRAWDMLRKQRPTKEKLVLLGPEVSAYGRRVRGEIRKLGLQKEVVILGKVPYRELPGYYQHAKINLFASSCENCPNILLEQLAGGRAVLASNYEPMPEIASQAALYFDPYDPGDLCQLIRSTIDDPMKLARLGSEAKRRSQSFTWERTRRETWRALLQLR